MVMFLSRGINKVKEAGALDSPSSKLGNNNTN